MNDTFDVIIIGYGPTGLVLASTLGRAGHRVAVVERWPQLYGLPRLSHLDDEAARIVQATADVDYALRDAEPISIYRFVDATGHTLTSVGSDGKLGPCGFPADISIYQPDIEEAIDARISTYNSVERLLGWEAVSLQQENGTVDLAIRAAGSDQGPTRNLKARYLVGCDGAKSFTREAVGITRTDFGFNERWLNIDVAIRRPLPGQFSQTIQYCDPARGHMHLPIGTKRLRFELALLPGEDASSFAEPEFAMHWLRQQHNLGAEDVEILRQVVYTFEARIADQWRKGTVLLAGDACHTMPPYLGQGACSGMRDGFNLGWRLDLILRGLSSQKLLDSYEVERKPHVTAITQMAIALGKIANERDPIKAQERDEALRTHPPQKMETPHLLSGVLDPLNSVMTGRVLPQGNVRFNGMEGRFDDVIGRGFVIMSSSPAEAVLDEETLADLENLGCIRIALDDFDDIDGVYHRFFDDHGIACVVARPDFIVFGTSRTLDESQRLIADLLGRLELRPGVCLSNEAVDVHP